jgi:selenocysteine lyase/cysteine desulfurase
MAGVAAAIDYLAELGQKADSEATDCRSQLQAAMHSISQYERDLVAKLIAGLLEIEGLTLYGITDPKRVNWRTPTVSIRINGYPSRQLAERLAEQGIFAWDGNFYALGLAERLGVESDGGMLRLGLVHYNTAEEVERLLETLRKIVGS